MHLKTKDRPFGRRGISRTRRKCFFSFSLSASSLSHYYFIAFPIIFVEFLLVQFVV
jgi:hypothetical protein